MGDVESLVSQLTGIRQEIEKAVTQGGPGPELLARLGSVAASVKSAAEKTMEGLKTEALAAAEAMREKAQEIERRKEARRNPPPPGPMPRPWEDHQGLAPDQMNSLVAALLRCGAATGSTRART